MRANIKIFVTSSCEIKITPLLLMKPWIFIQFFSANILGKVYKYFAKKIKE